MGLVMLHVRLPALVVVTLLLLTGCATSTAKPRSGLIEVVASTNVYGNIASAIGGTRVNVTSLITDSIADPHDFQGTARTQLALSRADVVIENGGGYDPFVDTLLSGANNPGARVLNVTAISRKTQTPDFNEHLWYDVDTMQTLVAHLVATFAAIEPEQASYFEANAQPYIGRLASLSLWLGGVAQRYGNRGVVMTEPLPGYLVAAAGLTDITPAEFSRAIESGADVAPDVMARTLALLTTKRAALVLYNTQTWGPQTDQVLAAAEGAGVATLAVSETLPAGVDYVDWMESIVRGLQLALR
jgi:zinc/manganese transport system substrate-binding protein